MTEAVLHTVVVLALLGAYLAITLSGGDGTALLGVLGGYVGGAGAQASLNRKP